AFEVCHLGTKDVESSPDVVDAVVKGGLPGRQRQVVQLSWLVELDTLFAVVRRASGSEQSMLVVPPVDRGFQGVEVLFGSLELHESTALKFVVQRGAILHVFRVPAHV